MFRGGDEIWNLRDRHMAETLEALVDHLEQTRRQAKVSRLGAQLAPGRREGDPDVERGELNVGHSRASATAMTR